MSNEGAERRALAFTKGLARRHTTGLLVGAVLLAASSAILASGGGNLASKITAVTAVVAVVGAAFSLREQRRIARLELTYNYVERVNDPQLMEHNVAAMSDFLRLDRGVPTTDAAVWEAMVQEDRIQAKTEYWDVISTPERARIMAFPNILEELAGMYNQGRLDAEASKVQFRETLSGYWELGAWFFERERVRRGNPNIFAQWERMKDDLERRP